MDTRRTVVTYWEDSISCVDTIEIESSDRVDFLRQMLEHAENLEKEGYEIAGMRHDYEGAL